MSCPFACDGCGEPRLLFPALGGPLLCPACFRKRGSPWDGKRATAAEVHQAELAARERMLARGGADRYMVRSGRT